MIEMKNISIKNRLIAIFLVWIIFFVGFGMFAVSEIRKLKEVTTEIYEQGLKLNDIQADIHVNMIKIQRTIRDIILTDTPLEFQQRIEEMNALERNVNENIEGIRALAKTEEELHLKTQVRDVFEEWKEGRNEIVELVAANQPREAMLLTMNQHNYYIRQIETSLDALSVYQTDKASELIQQTNQMERSHVITFITLMIFLSIIAMMTFFLVMGSILNPIISLKKTMYNSTNEGDMMEFDIEGENEIADMARHYNLLIKRLKEQFWLKDGHNQLNEELHGNLSLQEFTQKVINYLARKMDAGKGVFYLYNHKEETLHLSAAYAFTEGENLFNCYSLGQGIVGQAALEKRPILLKNIQPGEALIETGTIKEVPLNTYTFPLIYEKKIYGVIELASFEAFTDLKQKFINEAMPKIATNLYATIQNNEIIDLLQIAEDAQKKAQNTAEKLQIANDELEEKQMLLHEQSSELQENNAQLEEQQQLLEEQSDQLQQINLQLEEKQRQLQQQSRLLSIQNENLELSRIELTKRTEELERSNKYKSEFLANVSHELRTPLNSIILLSKLILKNKKDEFHQEGDLEKLNIIHSCGNELLRLINDILDLSKIESGKLAVEVEEFASKELIEELNQMFKGTAEEKKIQFIKKDLWKNKIIGDKNKISQILRNFLSNAFKFTKKGEVILEIAEDKEDQDSILFSVKDTGIGIAEDKQEIIFHEFKQVDGSISRKYGGTGLGLSIAKKLAKLMKGEIQLNSIEGEGSAFTLRLKKAENMFNKENSCDMEPYYDIIRTGLSQVSSTLSNDTDEQNKKNILIIEDDESFANQIKGINHAMGFNTLIAYTGSQGLQMASRHKVEGILLDLSLPDMYGLEVLKKLKSIEELRTIPVHIISISDKDMEAQKNGAIGYNEKPVDEAEIIDLISKMMTFSHKEPKELLIVENNGTLKELIGREIPKNEIKINTIATEAEAVIELSNGNYDAIVLDVGLQEGNALNICQYMSMHKIEIPTIIYTQEDLSTQHREVLQQYSRNIVVKTVNSREGLLDEVTLFLHKLKNSVVEDYYDLGDIDETLGLDLTGKDILIVDDDPRNIFALATGLENYGATIYDADNGEVALERLNEITPDLILMDIMMPVMDGYETIQYIRQNRKFRNIPIIAITAKTLKEDRAKCIEAGANDYITKPVDFDTLIRLVKAWMNKHQ
ncbi:hypothetical protein SAMN05660297_02173 [Natronincola peptidivorans]|uniref:Circadian input-output histidine kinase CikA n=1 Tax=Natronincola peptidivorans TaxID=426128 RepID=A0A1I0DVT8_9FIRM|nr:response regulator [Natronincola peptidivorans]SET36796.1 hypothetical protein SAMN05660297_02173 [Natronincola peptidivorans]